MTTNEFLAWLDGYLLDRAQPDAMVIAAKARGIAQPMFQGPITQIQPFQPGRLVPNTPPYTTC